MRDSEQNLVDSIRRPDASPARDDVDASPHHPAVGLRSTAIRRKPGGPVNGLAHRVRNGPVWPTPTPAWRRKESSSWERFFVALRPSGDRSPRLKPDLPAVMTGGSVARLAASDPIIGSEGSYLRSLVFPHTGINLQVEARAAQLHALARAEVNDGLGICSLGHRKR